MGAWGIGPFANDDAADFAGDLDGMAISKRVTALAQALSHAIDEDDYLEADSAAVAIAAAALIAARHTGTEPVDSIYGPKESLPTLPVDLIPLAVRAVDRVLADDCELKELWNDTPDAHRWLDQLTRLRESLVSASQPS